MRYNSTVQSPRAEEKNSGAPAVSDGLCWHLHATRGLVASLTRGSEIIGWIATAIDGNGVIATPRIGTSRQYLAIDRAQRWLETIAGVGATGHVHAIVSPEVPA